MSAYEYIINHFSKFGLKLQRKLSLILFPVFIIISGFENISGQTGETDTISVSVFGKVYLYRDVQRPTEHLIIMISGDGGWKYGVVGFAKEFVKTNSIVAGIDILKYYKNLRQADADCYHVFSDFVELAAIIEKKYNFVDYIPPVIMGYSSGATLVYGILSQARPGTFIGGISLGFCPDIELPRMLCQTNGLEERTLTEGKSYLFIPNGRLGNPWILLHGRLDKVCDFQTANDFVMKCSNARLIALDKAGHGFSKWTDFMPQWKAAYSDLIEKYDKTNISIASTEKYSNPDRVPYTFIKEKINTGSNVIAVFLSGDGGWYGFEEAISAHLGNLGIPVIGLDTKKYFWNRKTPEQTASDIADLMRFYGNELKKTEFVLCGYSQGAELVPFVFNRLPEELKSQVKSVVMLSPETTTDFEIHVSNMIGLGNRKNTFDVIAQIKENKESRQIIIFGENEKTLVPELLRETKVDIVKIAGDHHYNGNAGLIVEKMKENGAL